MTAEPSFESMLRRIVQDAVREALGGVGQVDEVGVSVERAAALLGIGKRKMEELIASGEIPSRTIGDRRIIRRSALEEYLRAGESGGVSCSAIEDQVFGKPKQLHGKPRGRAASTNPPMTATGRRS